MGEKERREREEGGRVAESVCDINFTFEGHDTYYKYCPQKLANWFIFNSSFYQP